MTQVSLEEVASLLDGVTWHGEYLRAFCPFHADKNNPSVLVYPDGFSCRSPICQERGSLEWLHRKLTGQGRKPGRGRKIGKRRRAGPPLPHNADKQGLEEVALSAHMRMLRYKHYSAYLQKRGLGGRIEPQRLGWLKGWYVIPVFTTEYTLATLALRAAPATAKTVGQRFVMPPGSEPVLYVPNWQRWDGFDYVVLAFGWFDALTLCELGLPVGTVQPGDLSPHKGLLQDVRKPIYLIPDTKGMRAAKDVAAQLEWRGRILELPYGEGITDVNDFITHGKQGLLEASLREELSW